MGAISSSAFSPSSIPDLTGKVAVVTGGNRGLGLEITHLLASRNCIVYIASRSSSGYESALNDLSTRLTSEQLQRIHYQELDLSHTEPARKSAETLLSTLTSEHGGLDILICNAGISMDPGISLSAQGWEKMFQTNHLGHFAFVTALLPAVEAAAEKRGEARVVVMSSNAHAFVQTLDFDKLRVAPKDTAEGKGGMKAAMTRYGATKLANMLFVKELDRRLREKDTGNAKGKVWVNSSHPGTILATGLGGNGEEFGVPSFVVKMIRLSGKLGIGFSVLEGAMTPVFCATSPKIVENDWHGRYFVPVKNWLTRYNDSAPEKPSKAGEDDELARKLWEVSVEAVEKGRKEGAQEDAQGNREG